MSQRISGLLVLLAALAGQPLFAQAPEASKPIWVLGHDLSVRKAGMSDFNDMTPKVGIELFKHDATGSIIAITPTGSIAVTPTGPIGMTKTTKWLFANDLRVRKADEEKFTNDTAKIGIEVYKDLATNKLISVSEKSYVALSDAPANITGEGGDPNWHHALTLKVRSVDQAEFSKAKSFGIEAFLEAPTGKLIYLTETGAIAMAPAPATRPDPKNLKKPSNLYGLTPRVRKSTEADFSDKTRKYGVEVFRDENTGGLIYLCETGAIATAPAPATIGSGRGLSWKYAMTIKARPTGTKEFDKAPAFGVEVFQDNNTGYWIFVSETGSIAVLPK